jgi:hypothetical protein
MSAAKNAGGWRLDDTNELYPLYVECLRRIERMSGPNNERDVLRKVRTLAYWMVSTCEAAYERDAETEAVDMIDADLRRILAERGEGEGDAVE